MAAPNSAAPLDAVAALHTAVVALRSPFAAPAVLAEFRLPLAPAAQAVKQLSLSSVAKAAVQLSILRSLRRSFRKT